MFADTNSMRKLLEAAEGNLVVMVKADVAALLKLCASTARAAKRAQWWSRQANGFPATCSISASRASWSRTMVIVSSRRIGAD